ncbi:hypothetical protein [Streptococcus sp. S784/96/1]|uniref:hypothetical protein n=1 Tax=Streptococcus sp. S784/96/1 TaxID=2653499 RepID=UPI00138A6983|nr:hypothetical protein [Streptococcus sp. S784/96/1]
MNKRIKKKKAKQAELQRQQELEQLILEPEKVRLALTSIGNAFSYMFANLSVAFANAAESVAKWAKQIEGGG